MSKKDVGWVDACRETQEEAGRARGVLDLAGAAEVVSGGQVLEMLCSLSQQDFLMGATRSATPRELLRVTAMFSS